MTQAERERSSDGNFPVDVRAELLGYSRANAYPIDYFAHAVCGCGGQKFQVALDDAAGVAVRYCAQRGHDHPIGDSAEFLDDPDVALESCCCRYDGQLFEITIGVHLYRESDDVRWVSLGQRCVSCGLAGCYGDWKNESESYREFLRLV